VAEHVSPAPSRYADEGSCPAESRGKRDIQEILNPIRLFHSSPTVLQRIVLGYNAANPQAMSIMLHAKTCNVQWCNRFNSYF
jgi:hypothetical protein